MKCKGKIVVNLLKCFEATLLVTINILLTINVDDRWLMLSHRLLEYMNLQERTQTGGAERHTYNK